LALNLAAFMLLVMANVFPFITLNVSGRIEENVFLSGALALYRLGMGELGLLVFLTSFLFPLLTTGGMLYILFPMKLGFRAWKTASVYRLVRAIMPWSLTAVFMLGVLISFVKLLDIAAVIPGYSLYCFGGLMVLFAAAHANMDPLVIWPPMTFDLPGIEPGATAARMDLVRCHTCGLLVPEKGRDEQDRERCPRCWGSLHSRKVNSLARTTALIFTASLLLIPANIYPVMTLVEFGQGDSNTILGGVVYLIEDDMWVLAMIIFFASIVVPVLKLITLSFILISIKKRSSWRPGDRAHLFRIAEGVGAWSMVDIYVVAILAGLVNLGALSTVRPEIGATFFGAVVVVTMFAAHSFDPRLIWDNSE
jgi:paraquat-inducible protein A